MSCADGVVDVAVDDRRLAQVTPARQLPPALSKSSDETISTSDARIGLPEAIATARWNLTSCIRNVWGSSTDANIPVTSSAIAAI